MPPKRTRKPTAKAPVASDKENSNSISEPASRKRTLDEALVADDSDITSVKEKATPVTPTREGQGEGHLTKKLKLPDDETKMLLENLQVEGESSKTVLILNLAFFRTVDPFLAHLSPSPRPLPQARKLSNHAGREPPRTGQDEPGAAPGGRA